MSGTIRAQIAWEFDWRRQPAEGDRSGKSERRHFFGKTPDPSAAVLQRALKEPVGRAPVFLIDELDRTG